jgi:hypothetical protein
MAPGAKAQFLGAVYAALKRRSSTVAEADGIAGGIFAGGRDSRFLSGFAGSE